MENRSGNPGAAEGVGRAEAFARRLAGPHRLAKRLLGDGRGNVMVVFAVALTVIVGAVGLGTDAASWYATKRQMQNAADLAAAGAINSLKSYYPSGTATTASYAKSEGKSAAALHGFVNGTSGTTVSIQIKGVDSAIYSSANYTGAPTYGAAEAVVTQPAPLEFASLFMTGTPTIVARSLTRLNTSSGDCMLSLDTTKAMAFFVKGNATINAQCGIADASCNSTDAFHITGTSANLTASGIRVCGVANDLATDPIFANAPLTTGDQSITDPYAGNTLPTLAAGYPDGSTTWPGKKLSSVSITDSSKIYSPPAGNITSSVDLSSMSCSAGCLVNGSLSVKGATLTLGTGVYFVSGSINLQANAHLVATSGTTIVLTNSSTASSPPIGTITMDAQASMSLLAPSSTSGQPGYSATQTFPGLAGIALLQDPRASTPTIALNGQSYQCTGNCNNFQGTTGASITGAVYMPRAGISWAGNDTLSSCFQLIGDTLYLQGDPGISVSNCTQGEKTFGPTTVSMVE